MYWHMGTWWRTWGRICEVTTKLLMITEPFRLIAQVVLTNYLTVVFVCYLLRCIIQLMILTSIKEISGLIHQINHNLIKISKLQLWISNFLFWKIKNRALVWCQNCKHGGHTNHILEWFKENQICPISNCMCSCSLL